MINKNFISAIKQGVFSNGSVNFRNSGGTLQSWDYSFSENFSIDITDTDYPSGENGIVLLLGTGGTEANIDDYKLDSIWTGYDVISQISTNNNNNPSDIHTEYNNKAIVTSRTVYNNTSESVTIKEMALCICHEYMGCYVIAREVLQEPVTIKGYESYTFTMSIGIEL